MKEKDLFTKSDSLCIYGVSVLMLVYHHLLCDPKRLEYPYITIFSNSQIIANYCHLCVGLYAFITGYGLAHKFIRKESIFETLFENLKICIFQIFKFFLKYWKVFILFISIGIIIGKVNFNIKEFLMNFFGFSNSYNNEWWYVKQYVKMLICLPFFDVLYKIHPKYRWIMLCICTCMIFSPMKMFIFYLIKKLNIYTFIMFEGYLFARGNLIEKTFKNAKHLWYFVISVIITFLRIIVSPNIMDTRWDWLFAPFFIVGITGILNVSCFDRLRKILKFIGKYSVYIWLSHTFFLYYYFQKIIFKCKYTGIIYTMVVFLCICIGIILDKINILPLNKLKNKQNF